MGHAGFYNETIVKTCSTLSIYILCSVVSASYDTDTQSAVKK